MSSENLHFPFSLSLRLDWSEMDLFGHINNVSYFKYIQASRVHYWEQSGISELFEKEKKGPILASLTCNFKKPLHYPGEIKVLSRIEFIRNSSFGIHHRIIDEQNEIAAEAHDVIVFFDFNKNEKMNFPDDLKKKVEAIEGRVF